ncbi:MAG: hypothetical protein IT357_12865 [Gemmatimonadaceae bacterium]|nr:hypothetical protein [Gemmatimonadaceae bacterium]
MRSSTALVVLVLLALGSTIGETQSPIPVTHLSPNVACPRCRIEVKPSISIGDDDGPGILGGYPNVVLRMPSGSLVLAGGGREDQAPRFFDARGRYVRTVGRFGAGPREFQFVRAGFVQGDSVYLVDVVNARLSVVRPTSGVVREVRLDPPINAPYASAFGGGIALSGGIAGADGRSAALQRYGRDGKRIGSMGTADQLVSRFGFIRWQQPHPARDGGLWSVAGFGAYVIHRWDADGRPLRNYVGHSSWFTAGEGDRAPSPHEKPSTELQDVWEDANGLLWVIALIEDPNWARALGPERIIEGRSASEILRRDRYYDTMIEVIDTKTWRVISRQRFDLPATYVLDDATIGVYDSWSDDDIPRVRTFTLTLRGWPMVPRR